ncbi:hypothetical protein GTP44_13275 [Duganella sp. FT50W]|uniref:Uncharacterized protein n=1 Tax=Duganella lactea TaxID=2692173 RepID=A0A6L8MM78_9BURK|nr:hypothetical protein [Duganella lactea]
METSKPDLLTASPRAAVDKRILAQLEHGPRTPAIAVRAAGWTIDGWTIGLCALLLVMCSVAWLMHDNRITPQTFRSAASTAAPSTALPARTIPATHEEAATGVAAAIINEPATADHVATSATISSGPDTVPTAAIATAAAPAPSRAAPHKPAGPTARPPVAKSPTPTGVDTDVTLLTALVAHAGKPALVSPERSRDIVERQDGDTTAQLLARCKQLGMIEGMLCRSRICSGRWETDAACRVPAH